MNVNTFFTLTKSWWLILERKVNLNKVPYTIVFPVGNHTIINLNKRLASFHFSSIHSFLVLFGTPLSFLNRYGLLLPYHHSYMLFAIFLQQDWQMDLLLFLYSINTVMSLFPQFFFHGFSQLSLVLYEFVVRFFCFFLTIHLLLLLTFFLFWELIHSSLSLLQKAFKL